MQQLPIECQPFGPDSARRVAYLQQVYIRDGLTPEEEGERRGLASFPENKALAQLVQKDYLASLGMAFMDESEIKLLETVRHERYLAAFGNHE